MTMMMMTDQVVCFNCGTCERPTYVSREGGGLLKMCLVAKVIETRGEG